MSNWVKSTNRTDPTKGAYNGYSLHDRGETTTWAKGHRDLRPSRVPNGYACAICGNTGGQRGWHSEDYHAPLDSFAVCAFCHWALHSRFRPKTNIWEAWKAKLTDGFRPPACEWGTRWATYGARYTRRDPAAWDWIDYGEAWHSPLADLLLPDYTMTPAPGLHLTEGDDPLPGERAI